ncbi:MAG: cyclase family protein [Candidatus Nanopelagicales bacterium]
MTDAGAPDIATVREMAAKYRNWGRWGAHDELGSLNFVTDAMRARAAGLVRRGKVFSLALPLDDEGPMTGERGRINPSHVMLWDGGDIASGAQDFLKALRYTDDAVYLVLQSSTQWDALAHIYFDGQMYNGYGTDQVTSRGALKNSITNVRDRAVGRGVLLDVARYKGVPWLESSYAITDEDLAGCATTQGVSVGAGDFVLVRTGQLGQRRLAGAWGDYAGGPAPGLGITAADYFCPREVAAVATDTWGTEVLPNETEDVFQPLHVIMLVNAGIILGEMWDMDALADDCASDGIYEFLLVAPPLTVTRSVGSPVNPQAIK